MSDAAWRARAEALASYVLGRDDSTAAGARHIVVGNHVGYVWEPDGPRPVESRPGQPAEPDHLRDAIRSSLRAAVDRMDNESICALVDALRAVEGR